MRSAKKRWKIAIPVLILLAALVYVLADPDISAQTLLDYTPSNLLLAAVLLLLLYAAKSATIVFPLAVLQIAAGLLFPAGIALLVNLAGLAVLVTVPYWLGRFSGLEAVSRLIQRYPKFGAILEHQQSSSFFLSFFLRLIGGLPGDVVTMYLGAAGTSYYQNLIGGILGLLPRMVLTTILGASIQDPASPAFWISMILRILLSVFSLGGYYLYRRHLRRSAPRPEEREKS